MAGKKQADSQKRWVIRRLRDASGVYRTPIAVSQADLGGAEGFEGEFVRHKTGLLILETTRDDVAEYFRKLGSYYEIRNTEPEDFSPHIFLRVNPLYLSGMIAEMENPYWIVELKEHLIRRNGNLQVMANIDHRIQVLKQEGVVFPTPDDLREEMIRRNSPLPKPEKVVSGEGGVEGWKTLMIPQGLEESEKPIEITGRWGMGDFFGVRLGDLPQEFQTAKGMWLAHNGYSPSAVFYASQIALEYLTRKRAERDEVLRKAEEARVAAEAEAEKDAEAEQGGNPAGKTPQKAASEAPVGGNDAGGGKDAQEAAGGELDGDKGEGNAPPDNPPANRASDEEIREAMQRADPDNDEHWTGSGEVRMEWLESEVNDKTITRDQVRNILPDFNRDTARSGSDDGGL